MIEERDRTLQALRTAVQMEIDGKAFYLKASRESGNELGKKLLQNLSDEEDLHRQRFEAIYHRLHDEKAWPEIEPSPEQGNKLKTLFAMESEKAGTDTIALDTELDAVQEAMDMEIRSYDFYREHVSTARYETERRFYEKIAEEEKVHHILLLDYYEYLKDPAQWFVSKEHPSLDG